MDDPAPPPLQYHRSREGSGRWAVASVAVAGAAYAVVFGTALLIPYVPRPAGGFLTVVVVATTLIAFVALFAPVAGVTFGALGLRQNMRRRRLALAGVLLNLSMWGFVLLMWVMQRL
jgi:multisubunit Na+/H+ antiporter MnhB subunit